MPLASASRPNQSTLDHQLSAACLRGDALATRSLLNAGASPTADCNESMAIIEAASHGHLECVRLLLPWARPGQCNRVGQTAPMLAALGGHAECLKALLPFSDPDDSDEDGWTALTYAISYRHDDCVAILAPVSSPFSTDADEWTALIFAASAGQAEMVRILLSHGADALACDSNGYTPLMIACCGARSFDAECARLLIPSSDIFAKSNLGETALLLAAMTGAERCVKLLIEHHRHEPAELFRVAQQACKTPHGDLADFIFAYASSLAEQSAVAAACPEGSAASASGPSRI